MFCLRNPVKANKARRPRNSDTNGNNNNSNNINHSNGHSNEHNQHNATSIPYRYVTSEFNAVAEDELSVVPGDVVFYEFTDSSSSGNWAHVLLIRTNKRGFIPMEILSTERPSPQCKKKIPRSLVDPIEHHHHPHLHHHHHHHQTIQKTLHAPGQTASSSNGDNNLPRLQHPHVRSHHQPKYGMPPHSLQGSSSRHSFQNYNHLRHFTPPAAYYNLETSEPPFIETECRPFHRVDYGLYVVIHNFVAREENDLSVRPCDYVTVLNKDDEDWYWVRRDCDMNEGFVPRKFICDFDQVSQILNKGNSTVTMKSSNHNDFHTYINHRPDRESLPTDQQSSVLQQI